MISLTTYQPRPYQTDCIAALAEARVNGTKKGLVVMASGLGKTLTTIFDLQQFLRQHPNAHTLYLCDKESILAQSKAKFQDVFGEERSYGMFTGNEKATEPVDFLFATFQTMRNYRDEFSPDAFDYIVVDEAHHTAAETYQPTADYFAPQFLLGLTATKGRMDGQDILDTYGEILYQMDIYDGWATGWLARVDYRIMFDDLNEEEFKKYIDPQASEQKVSLAQLNRTIFAPQRDADIVKSIREQSSDLDNPRIFIFCSSINHANAMAHQFGGEAAVIHSEQSANLNEAILSKFRSGEIRIVISVNMLNEGIDVPEADVIVFLRSTESPTIFFQQLGRGLRISTTKRTVRVLDYVVNLERISTILEMEETSKKRIPPHSNISSPVDRPDPLVVNIPVTKFRVERVDVERMLYSVKTFRTWSDEELLEAISEQARLLERTPTMSDMNKNDELPCSTTYFNRFGSWVRALKLCNLEPSKRKWDEWTDDDLLELVLSKSQNGSMPSVESVQNDPNLPPLKVLYRRFGSWGDIAKRLDLKLNRIQEGRFEKKTKAELREILQQEAKKLNGAKLSKAYMMAHPELPAADAFVAAFGSWNAALQAAGLTVNQSTTSDEELLSLLRRKAKALGRTPTRKDVREDKEMPSDVTYANRFGGFLKALELAGLSYSNRPGWKRDEKSQQMLDLEMLKKLRELIDQLGRRPTRNEVDDVKSLASAMTYARHFGSLSKAIELAIKLENN